MQTKHKSNYYNLILNEQSGNRKVVYALMMKRWVKIWTFFKHENTNFMANYGIYHSFFQIKFTWLFNSTCNILKYLVLYYYASFWTFSSLFWLDSMHFQAILWSSFRCFDLFLHTTPNTLSTQPPLNLSHAWRQGDDLCIQSPFLRLLWFLITLELVTFEFHQLLD
jgi:hypothetical protein